MVDMYVWKYSLIVFVAFLLNVQLLQTLSLILSNFSKYIIPYLNGILEPIWLDLIQLRERYVSEFVRESGPDFETFQDSDGEVIGFETLLFEQFEFFGLASRKKSTRSLFLGPKGDGELLREVVYIILSYMQMTEDQVEAWLTDANQFVADEEDDTFSFNVRIAAEDLLLVLHILTFVVVLSIYFGTGSNRNANQGL